MYLEVLDVPVARVGRYLTGGGESEEEWGGVGRRGEEGRERGKRKRGGREEGPDGAAGTG